jgi:hypothetical protein
MKHKPVFFLVVVALLMLNGHTTAASVSDLTLPSAVEGLSQIELAYVDQFEAVWHHKGSGRDDDYGAYYRPVVPEGFYVLGYYGQGDSQATRGFSFAARELVPGALVAPVDYTKVWGYNGSDSVGYGSFWKPVPPTGYVCLGMVVVKGDVKPGPDAIRCVRKDLTVPALASKWIWDAYGSGSTQIFCSWTVLPNIDDAIYFDVFTAHNVYEKPAYPLYALDPRFVQKPAALTRAEVDGLIQTHGPILYFHKDENYYLDSPEWVLNSGVKLNFALVLNYNSYDNLSVKEVRSIDVTGDDLIEQTHYMLETFKPNPPYNNSPNFMYWLELPETDVVRAGDLNRGQALVHVIPWNTFFTELQFWFFYPNNGPGRTRACLSSNLCLDFHLSRPGRHYGDWEYVTMRFLNTTKELLLVYMSAHSGGSWYWPNDFDAGLKFEGGHPVVYPAKYSHANYAAAGTHYYQRVAKEDYWFGTFSVDLFDLTSKSLRFDTYTPEHYRIIASETFAVRKPDWLYYEGRWGQYEKLNETVGLPTPFGTLGYTYEEVGWGPSGPNKKDTWLRGLSALDLDWPKSAASVTWSTVYIPVVSK